MCEWFVCVRMVCMCEEWFVCVRMVCMCVGMVWNHLYV